MEILLPFMVLMPAIGLFGILFLPRDAEKAISWVSFWVSLLHLCVSVLAIWFWVRGGFALINLKEIVIYKTQNYEFFIDFYFDALSAVYILTGSLLTFLVTRYSTTYLHLEKGFKRFFAAMLLFFLGYNLVVLAGNFETLFLGWEMLGISSFLLIAFYRERYLPVKNAIKVFSIYRIGDVGFILVLWLSHNFWHENITFLKFSEAKAIQEHFFQHEGAGVAIALFVLLAAMVKSAQFPFSSWLARAMEGPSSSSAIFYGSLSVHIGAFLLLRTQDFWFDQIIVRVAIGVVGFLTAATSSPVARTQSSIKGQIAYSATAQIGLIFIEIALGLRYLAMLHFVGNAFLRSYQLLISPSVVAYLIREQHYLKPHFKPSLESSFPKKIRNTFYILSIKEWYLEEFLYAVLWKPLKDLGRQLFFLSHYGVIGFLALFYAGFRIWIHVSEQRLYLFSILISVLALLAVVRAFAERENAMKAWSLLTLSHFLRELAVASGEKFTPEHSLIYLSGVLFSAILGWFCLNRVYNIMGRIDLNAFWGNSEKHPLLNTAFLFATLGMICFPSTTAFLGKDLIFNHIHQEQILLVAVVSLTFVVDGIATIRIYARIFLGSNTFKELKVKSEN
jgi:NADH:ubiquinone oxidoreductase subunit 5 (subunit L)/multisubunit Na+/H+ antiporter MnhA subunit